MINFINLNITSTQLFLRLGLIFSFYTYMEPKIHIWLYHGTKIKRATLFCKELLIKNFLCKAMEKTKQ